MNSRTRHQRRSDRFTVAPDEETSPVMMRAPGLALDPFVPEDISASGFRVNITHRPKLGGTVPFSIRFGKTVLNGYTCQVVWAEKKLDETPPWTIGLAASITQEQQDTLLFHMTKALASGKLKKRELAYTLTR